MNYKYCLLLICFLAACVESGSNRSELTNFGPHEIRVLWSEDRSTQAQVLRAKPGGSMPSKTEVESHEFRTNIEAVTGCRVNGEITTTTVMSFPGKPGVTGFFYVPLACNPA